MSQLRRDPPAASAFVGAANSSGTAPSTTTSNSDYASAIAVFSEDTLSQACALLLSDADYKKQQPNSTTHDVTVTTTEHSIGSSSEEKLKPQACKGSEMVSDRDKLLALYRRCRAACDVIVKAEADNKASRPIPPKGGALRSNNSIGATAFPQLPHYGLQKQAQQQLPSFPKHSKHFVLARKGSISSASGSGGRFASSLNIHAQRGATGIVAPPRSNLKRSTSGSSVSSTNSTVAGAASTKGASVTSNRSSSPTPPPGNNNSAVMAPPPAALSFLAALNLQNSSSSQSTKSAGNQSDSLSLHTLSTKKKIGTKRKQQSSPRPDPSRTTRVTRSRRDTDDTTESPGVETTTLTRSGRSSRRATPVASGQFGVGDDVYVLWEGKKYVAIIRNVVTAAADEGVDTTKFVVEFDNGEVYEDIPLEDVYARNSEDEE